MKPLNESLCLCESQVFTGLFLFFDCVTWRKMIYTTTSSSSCFCGRRLVSVCNESSPTVFRLDWIQDQNQNQSLFSPQFVVKAVEDDKQRRFIRIYMWKTNKPLFYNLNWTVLTDKALHTSVIFGFKRSLFDVNMRIHPGSNFTCLCFLYFLWTFPSCIIVFVVIIS